MPDKRVNYDKWYALGCMSVLLAQGSTKDREAARFIMEKENKVSALVHVPFYTGRMDMAVAASKRKRRNA